MCGMVISILLWYKHLLRGFNQHPYDNDDKCYKCSTIGEVNILIRTLNNPMVVYINTLYLIV